jgi:hypothetical protein
MGQSYTLPERVKQSIIWIKLAFSPLEISPLLGIQLLLETSLSSLETSPLLISPSSLEISSLSLRTLSKDILLIIFKRLDVRSVTALEITCKYFKSIWESVPGPYMYMDFIPQVKFVDFQFLRRFRYLSKCISQDMKLRSLSEFNLVVSEGKTESSIEYFTKALLVQDKNLEDDELKLLESFVSKHPQTPILFWGGNPMFHEISISCRSLKKMRSLEYVCISNGCFSGNWPEFFNQFEQLKLVYFAPTKRCNEDEEQTWTINTRKTLFIMEFVVIKRVSGTLE